MKLMSGHFVITGVHCKTFCINVLIRYQSCLLLNRFREYYRTYIILIKISNRSINRVYKVGNVYKWVRMARKYSSSDTDLVAAALSTLTDNFIVSQRKHDKLYKNTSDKWRRHDITIGHSDSIQLSGKTRDRAFGLSGVADGVFVQDNNGQLYPIAVDVSTGKVADLKSKIERMTGVSVKQQSLIYGGEVLCDTDTLGHNSVCNQATLLLRYDREVSARVPQYLHSSDLAPAYNYDLSHLTDNGTVYRRGGWVYKRPYGWNRLALNVLGRYNSNTWLGLKGIRTCESTGEWMVSFHGVMESDFLGGDGERDVAGRVHSTADIDSVEFERFIKVFELGGSRFKAVFQNRVNPLNIEATEQGNFMCGIGDIRPYGICVKKIV